MNQLSLKLLKSHPLALVYKKPRFGYSNTWVGVFSTWAAAMAAIPPESPVGYDHEAATTIYSQYPTSFVRPGDYAIMLHLRNLIKEGMRVVDVGGSIGMAFYMALKYFSFPKGVEWVLYDVPAVLEAARGVAVREGEASAPLRFASRLEDAGNCDVFYSSGSLQLIEDTLPDLLKKLPKLPEHILINRIPVWDRPAIVSLNDMGFSLAPYNIFNRTAWVQAVEALGYKLVDDWACPESTFVVRFKPSTRLKAYRGFYFRRASQD